MEGTTTQNEESDRITNETRAKDNINDFLGAQTRSGKDLDTSLEAQLSSGNDDALHAEERSKLGHGTIAVGLEQPMQINNFDGVKAHFNPTFEGLEDVDVQLIKSILDPRKHSVGYASPRFPHVFREYNLEYKPYIISFLETKVSGIKVDKIIAKLGFRYSYRVEAIGYSEGIWIGWKNYVRVEVKRKNLWKELSSSLPVGQIPWETIGDFNVILSLNEK
ncbi:hypothetical protein Goari_011889 [Gossypium aridum]|uniref:Uncharacterized protein n=1 Tax=Gossypium aridum TaxID=34290 RepID=A0A7J8WYN5_GOSAI|nr:hypothetical protein [Gossypium aridum]